MKRLALELIQIAREITGKSGLQMNRKDKDVMTDTGGSSKRPEKEPNFKPPRDDVKKPFRSKDKPADQRDPDTDTDADLRSN
jgi:hypothetical protein